MKYVKEHSGGMVVCLCELLVGILLLIDPVGFTSAILMGAGVVLVAMGVVEVVKYFRADAREAALSQTLVKGILAVLGGGFCLFRTEWFFVTFPVLAMFYGAAILVTGISKIQLAMDLFRRGNKQWFWAAINAAVTIVCAVVVLRNPFASTAVLWMFTGISLIAEAVLDVVTMVMENRK